MTIRDVLLILLVLVLIAFFFPAFVPRLYTGGIGLVLLIVLVIVLLRG